MAEEDLIFGKKRHFFGGIEPSNMKAFKAEIIDNKVKIIATLPDDTVVNGNTLCTVAGAVIRRKKNTFPIDEFDGVLVANLAVTSSFIDEEVNSTETYYYSAFPYTTQDVYNRNPTNRFVINRPVKLTEFKAENVFKTQTNTPSIQISIKIPSIYSGVTIRKSKLSQPLTETDGELFKKVTTSGVYEDLNVALAEPCYYTAFPYIIDGQHLDVESNKAYAIPKPYNYMFGFDIDNAVSNPKTRVSYPIDVENSNFTPISNSNGVINYGDWNFKPGECFMPRPCMLGFDGVVKEYLDPNNYELTIDGIASKVSDVKCNANAMMEWPKIFTKRWEEDGKYKFRCSDVKIDSDWDCWCNYDRLNNQIEHFYTAIYFATSYSQNGLPPYMLRSLTYKNGRPSVNTTIEEFSQQAMQNGPDWTLETIADRFLIQDLLVLLFKTTNLDEVMGFGICSNERVLHNGLLNDKGLFYGEPGSKRGVKIFGMEHWWGNYDRPIVGINCYYTNTEKSKFYYRYKITRGTHDGTSSNDYNFLGDGYKKIAMGNNSLSGYANKMLTTPYGRLPISAGGSATTFEADRVNISSSDAAMCGGSNSYSPNTLGPFLLTITSKDTSNSDISATIACKPCKK